MYLERIRRAQKMLRQENHDLLILCDRENLIYFTGITEIECGGLLIPAIGEPMLVTLWLDLPHMKDRLAYEVVGYVYRRETLAQKMVEQIRKMGYRRPSVVFSKYFIEVGVYKTLSEGIEGMTIVDGGLLLYRLRSVKDTIEIEAINRASAIVVEGMRHAIEVIEPGMTETYVLGEAERAMRIAGSEGHPFRMQVLNESRQMMVHPIATDSLLENNQLVVIHLGATYKGYVSKMCRTVVLGRAQKGKVELLNALIRAQGAAIDAIAPGIASHEVYNACFDSLKNDGLEKYLIDDIGYGIGIRQSEFYPIIGKNREETLEKNMVIDLMFPTVYHPRYGGGRVADVIHIDDEPKVFTSLDKIWYKP